MNSVTTPKARRLSRQHQWPSLYGRLPQRIRYAVMAAALSWANTTMAAPLTADEQKLAQQLANALTWQRTAATAAPSAAADPTHPLAQQIISIEANVTKKTGSDAQARVYQFDYHSAIARLVVVSLTQAAVVSETLIPSVHLPLNPAESDAALTWLENDSNAVAQLRDEQIRRGRPAFNDLSELSVKASIFVPIDENHPCAAERCALLSLIDTNNTVFSLEPLVNLQRRTVGWLAQ